MTGAVVKLIAVFPAQVLSYILVAIDVFPLKIIIVETFRLE